MPRCGALAPPPRCVPCCSVTPPLRQGAWPCPGARRVELALCRHDRRASWVGPLLLLRLHVLLVAGQAGSKPCTPRLCRLQ